MKRISIVTLMAALVLLSGCNKDNEFNNSVDIDINNSSEVPIKLGTYGATSATTRASIESLDEMVGNDEHRVGVFCLAARRTDVKSAQTESDINWTTPVDSPSGDGLYGDDYGSSTNGRYWDNLCCEVKNVNGEYRIIPVQEGDDNYKPYYQYYPITSVFGYDFYSYYPYQDNAKVTCNKSSVYVNFAITGKEDIIYGKSEDVNDAYFSGLNVSTELLESLKKSYYSAKFFRKNPKKTDNAHIKLEHKLARFRFHVFPGPDSEYEEPKSYDDAKKLCVKEIKINQVPNQLRLVVADRANKNNAGTLSAVGSSKSDFYVFTEGGAALEDSPVVLGTKVEDGVIVPDTMEVGDYMMLPSGVSQYFMSVKLADANNPDRIYPSETNIAINLKNGKKFEPGKTYNVYLQVAGLKEIGISAELADWEDGDEMDLVEFN